MGAEVEEAEAGTEAVKEGEATAEAMAEATVAAKAAEREGQRAVETEGALAAGRVVAWVQVTVVGWVAVREAVATAVAWEAEPVVESVEAGALSLEDKRAAKGVEARARAAKAKAARAVGVRVADKAEVKGEAATAGAALEAQATVVTL